MAFPEFPSVSPVIPQRDSQRSIDRPARKALFDALARLRPRPRDIEAIIRDLERLLPGLRFVAWLSDAHDRKGPLAQLEKAARAFERALRKLPDDSAGVTFAFTDWPMRWELECGSAGWRAIRDRLVDDVGRIRRGAERAPRGSSRRGRPRAGHPALRQLAARTATVLRRHGIRPSAYPDGMLSTAVRELWPFISDNPLPGDLTRVLRPVV